MVIEWQGNFPAEYNEILSLPGIGEYTAGAIGSICFDLPTPAVDGNVLRVYTRVMEDPSNIDKQAVKKKIREELLQVYRYGHCDMLTQSLMEVGATICLPMVRQNVRCVHYRNCVKLISMIPGSSIRFVKQRRNGKWKKKRC